MTTVVVDCDGCGRVAFTVDQVVLDITSDAPVYRFVHCATEHVRELSQAALMALSVSGCPTVSPSILAAWAVQVDTVMTVVDLFD